MAADVGIFRQGDVFGEYALLTPRNNTATTCVATEARLLRLPLEPLLLFLGTQPDVQGNLKNWLRLHTLIAYLRERSFIGFMSGPSALGLEEHLEAISFHANETIQMTGLSDAHWFFIESGRVTVTPGTNGQPPVELGPGDCFGEQALRTKVDRLPKAVALTESRCLSLSRGKFDPPDHSKFDRSIQTLALGALAPSAPVWIGQQDKADCGLAALAMIAKALGKDVSFSELRRLVRIRSLGTSMGDLQKMANKLGVSCRPVRIAPDRLRQAVLPALAHLHDGHYVVVFRAGPDGIHLGDPATGIVTVSSAHFQKICSGNFLLFVAERQA